MDLHLIRVVRNKSIARDSLDRYADYIADHAKEQGITIHELEVDTTLNDGYSGFLKKGLLGPLRYTLGLKKRDVAHYTFEGLALFIPFCRARKIVTFHHVVHKDEGNPWKWYVLWRVSATLAVRYSDIILAVSEQTRDELLKEFNADPTKIRILSSAPNPELCLDPSIGKEKLIGYVGTLCERKNFSATLRVFAKLRDMEGFHDYRLRLCGKGPLKDRLISEAKELGIYDQVDFISDLTNDELRSLYNSCSLVFNTSLHEGVGFITIEAQNCGTPVLYFDYADIPEKIMVAAIPCSDESDMANKAAELLSDREKYDAIVERGLVASKEFDRLCAKGTLDLYSELSGPL